MINMLLSNLNMYYTWKYKRESYKTNEFKVSTPTWNEQFILPDGSYSAWNIPLYFGYILKKHETIINNAPTRIFVNPIENGITFKIKIEYYLQLLTSEIMKFLKSTKSNIIKDGKRSSFRNF